MFVRCPSCNAKLDVPAHVANAEVKCGRCGATFSPNLELQSELPQSASPQRRTDQSEMVSTAVPLKAVFPLSGLDATTLALAALSIFVGWLPIIGTVISLIAMIMGILMIFRCQTDRFYHHFVVIPAAVVPCIALVISVTLTAIPIAKASGLLDSEKESEIADAATQIIECGKVRVGVKQVRVGSVTVGGDVFNLSKKLDGPMIEVHVEVANVHQNETVRYHPWWRSVLFPKPHPALALESDSEKSYPCYKFFLNEYPENGVESSTVDIPPNNLICDVLVFTGAIDHQSSDLLLRLPCKNSGYEGVLRFRVPRSMMTFDAH